MKGFLTYLRLQIKRMMKAFPVVTGMTLLLAVLIGGIWVMQTTINSEDLGTGSESDSDTKLVVGYVGNQKDSYLGMGISVVTYMDSSKSFLSLKKINSIEEADKMLDDGAIMGYIIFPENFVSSLVFGENNPVSYVSGNASGGIDSALIQELAAGVSDIIKETESRIYALQDMYLAKNMTVENEEEQVQEEGLNRQLFKLILGRESSYSVEKLGTSKLYTKSADDASFSSRISVNGYYFAALFLLFLLLWGIPCSGLLIHKDQALSKTLAHSGINIPMQLLGEWGAYLVLFLSNVLVVGGIFAAIIMKGIISIKEIKDLGDILIFGLRLIPVLLFVATLQFFIYNLVDGIISGVLLNFMTAMVLSFLAGCFYPISWFPEAMQRFCLRLPGYYCLRYMTESIKASGTGLGIILLMTLILMIASVFVKTKKAFGALS